MFYAAGAFPGDAILLLLPAAVSAVAGLLLWGRGSQGVVSPHPELRPVDPQVERIEGLLVALQADVAHLRDDREFFHELYAGSVEQPKALRK